MRLVAVPEVTYRCLTCGAATDLYPDVPCCREPDETPAGSRLLTRDDVAERTQVSRSTVDGWIAKGKLPAMRVGTVVRVAADDLEDFVRSNR